MKVLDQKEVAQVSGGWVVRLIAGALRPTKMGNGELPNTDNPDYDDTGSQCVPKGSSGQP